MTGNGTFAISVRVTSAGLVVNTKQQLRRVMRQAGADIAKAARALIRGSTGGGRLYYGSGGSSSYRGGYRKGRFTASAPGQAPHSVTGTLARSIKVRPYKSGEGVAIRDSMFYGLFLEAGAKGGGGNAHNARNVSMIDSKTGRARLKKRAIGTTRVLAPRPFLSAALAARTAQVQARIQAAVDGDIKFVARR